MGSEPLTATLSLAAPPTVSAGQGPVSRPGGSPIDVIRSTGDDGGMTRRGIILFVLLGVAWGIPYLLIKIAVGELTPAMLVFARTAVAAVVLLPFAAAQGELRPVLRKWRPLAAFTLAELIVPQLLLGSAEERLPSSTTGLLIAAVPLAGVGVAFLFGRPERLAPHNWGGIALGMTGVATLAGFAVSAADLGALAEVLIVVLCYALGPAILARWMPGLSATGITAVGLTITAVVYAPAVAATHSWPSRWPSASVLVSVLVLAVVCSAGALTMMAALVTEAGPVRATAVTYVNPAVALVAGAVILGEPVTGWSVAGFVLVLAGCVLVALRGQGTAGGRRRGWGRSSAVGGRRTHATDDLAQDGPRGGDVQPDVAAPGVAAGRAVGQHDLGLGEEEIGR
jgi:drug/metabolite transporter (DMT)-like permease